MRDNNNNLKIYIITQQRTFKVKVIVIKMKLLYINSFEITLYKLSLKLDQRNI